MDRINARSAEPQGVVHAIKWLLVSAALVVLVACAATAPRERQAARLEKFQMASGEPVESFRFWDLQRFEILGRDKVAVWTRINEAWLLTVDGPCSGLEFAQVIALTSSLQRVSRRFDSVIVDGLKCRIVEISPVDGKALKAQSD